MKDRKKLQSINKRQLVQLNQLLALTVEPVQVVDVTKSGGNFFCRLRAFVQLPDDSTWSVANAVIGFGPNVQGVVYKSSVPVSIQQSLTEELGTTSRKSGWYSTSIFQLNIGSVASNDLVRGKVTAQIVGPIEGTSNPTALP